MTQSLSEFREHWNAFKGVFNLWAKEHPYKTDGYVVLPQPTIDQFVHWLETGKIE